MEINVNLKSNDNDNDVNFTLATRNSQIGNYRTDVEYVSKQ